MYPAALKNNNVTRSSISVIFPLRMENNLFDNKYNTKNNERQNIFNFQKKVPRTNSSILYKKNKKKSNQNFETPDFFEKLETFSPATNISLPLSHAGRVVNLHTAAVIKQI